MTIHSENVSLEKLHHFIERLENLEEQKTELQEFMQDVMLEAKASGLDPKIIRKVLKIRKMKPEDINEEEEMIHLYLSALKPKISTHHYSENTVSD